MRKLADNVVNALLRAAPWYKPEEIEARDQRADAAIESSKEARLDAEKAAGRGLGSYSRAKLRR